MTSYEQALADYYKTLDALCWKAVEKGSDLAVSPLIVINDAEGFRVTFRYKLVAPGEPADFGAPCTIYHTSRLQSGRA